MRNLILASFATLIATVSVKAQDLEQVKKTIDSEKFSEARKTLKGMIAAQPEKGKNYFYLGQVYLALDKADSAKIYFDKGLAQKENQLNYVGLGHIELLNGNDAAAETNFASALAIAKKKDVEEQIFISKAYLKAKNINSAKAVEAAKKAVASDANSALAKLALGDAYLADKKASEAYGEHYAATTLDPNLLRAKLQLAISARNSFAFPESLAALNKIIAANGSYGPAYRELAETNLGWAFRTPSEFDTKVKTALEDYKRYMALTDSSVDSKLKYADFLILTKQWKELETVAKEIQNADKVNPKVLRYLGYAAYENGNKEVALKALTDFIAKTTGKVTGSDYLYLGKIKIANASDAAGIVTNQAKFTEALADFSKSIELAPTLSSEFTDIGINLYKAKSYLEAAKLFDLAVKNPKSKSIARDNLLLGNAVLYYTNGKTDAQKATLGTEFARADKAYADGITFVAEDKTQDFYYNKAQLNRIWNTPASNIQAIADYQGYVDAVFKKGETETSKPEVKDNLFDAYVFIGANNALTNKTVSLENFKKALEIKPTDTYCLDAVKAISAGGNIKPKTSTPTTTTTNTTTPATKTPQKKK